MVHSHHIHFELQLEESVLAGQWIYRVKKFSSTIFSSSIKGLNLTSSTAKFGQSLIIA